MIYVASPYSHPNSVIRDRRFRLAQEFIVHLVKVDHITAFSPTVYWHEIAKGNHLPTDAGWWMQFNLNVLRRSECLFVLQINGWEESQGMKVELNIAQALSIPRVDFDKDFVNLTEEAHAKNPDSGLNPGGDQGPIPKR